MKQRILGQTGLSVSEIALGGLFTSSLGPSYEDSKRAVFAAVDRGINYIDTAPAYADSEEILGRILREVKVPLILSTKLGGRPKPFDPQNKQQLHASVRESLRLLGREVIDVLFIHEPDRALQYAWWTDPERAFGPVVEVLDELKQQGLIRFTGLGGTTTTEMAHYLQAGSFDVVLTAFNYSALFREATLEVLPNARAKKMGIVLGSTLQQGALGRRYDAVVGTRPVWLSKARQEQFQQFYRFLDETGMSIVECCLRFALSRSAGDTVLIGPKTEKHIQEAVEVASRGPLPDAMLQRLDALAARVPNRPFEEPMILPFSNPKQYAGPGLANLGVGAPVGK